MDPATFSNFNDVIATHYSLDWKVDFNLKRIAGTVIIDLDVKQATDKVILDGRDLQISSVKLNDQTLKWNTEPSEVLGDKICIDLPQQEAGSKLKLSITYTTAPEARALQFLNAEQTTDRKSPYLFSQCQAIHARSILPCMDTPSVKASYDAKVSVPAGLTCLMSAIGGTHSTEGDLSSFNFNQPIAVPPYLIAIVVGCLEKRDISDRCAVWAEPSQVEAAHWEFEETEKILKVAEDLAGKYVWGRYDLVVLPATFPLGGMENPCLTFVTPTILAGDRSLVNVVAHEISHSWTGNLVTNANWEHFWLNEGFTVFLERKIHGRMFGEKERQFESERGWEEALVPTVNKVLGPGHEFTKLIQNQKGIDPDDAFSRVPYEKGSSFLLHIEETIGDKMRMEEWLRQYIATFANKSLKTDDMKGNLYEFFSDKKAALDGIDWQTWLTAPGIPPARPNYDTTLMDQCRRLGKAWIGNDIPKDGEEFKNLSSSQKVAVIDMIRANGKLSEDKLEAITSTYSLEKTQNCELKFSWLMLGLESEWKTIVTPALAFVLNVGRLKYCKPIYKALFNWDFSSAQAVGQFKKNIGSMHPITALVISKLLPK